MKKLMPLTIETTKDCRGIIHIGTSMVTGDELIEPSRRTSILRILEGKCKNIAR